MGPRGPAGPPGKNGEDVSHPGVSFFELFFFSVEDQVWTYPGA